MAKFNKNDKVVMPSDVKCVGVVLEVIPFVGGFVRVDWEGQHAEWVDPADLEFAPAEECVDRCYHCGELAADCRCSGGY